ELRQPGEYRGRIALGRGRLADSEADFALRLREARQRIHDEQHIQSLVAEILGDRRGAPGAVQAHERRIVRRGRHHDRSGAALRPQNALDEFLHLATALADQSDDDDVGARVARHHPEQHALAHAAASEQADTLPAPDGEQCVDGAYADVKRLLYGLAQQRVDRRARESHALRAVERSQSVERLAGAVDDPAEQPLADSHRFRTDARYHTRIRLEAMDVAGGHEEQTIAGEADDLGLHSSAVRSEHLAAVADCSLASGGFERQPDHPRQHAFDRRRRQTLDALRATTQLLRPVGRAAHDATRAPGARSSPSKALIAALSRVSRRASMFAVSVLTRQPPRVSTGSST